MSIDLYQMSIINYFQRTPFRLIPTHAYCSFQHPNKDKVSLISALKKTTTTHLHIFLHRCA